MFKQFRPIMPGEFIIAGGDCSQGGSDYNACQFLSANNFDVPLVYHARGVATTMTSAVYPVLERIADRTGVKPVVGFERQMGGASEMERLNTLNRLEKYTVFVMPKIGGMDTSDTDKFGVDTNAMTRPVIVGGIKEIVDIKGIMIHDRDTIEELAIFIENNSGKPEAAQGGHDDLVMSLGIAWFIRRYAKSEPLNKPKAHGTVAIEVSDDPYQ